MDRNSPVGGLVNDDAEDDDGSSLNQFDQSVVERCADIVIAKDVQRPAPVEEPVGLSPDLMRCAVVDPQRMGSSAYVDTGTSISAYRSFW